MILLVDEVIKVMQNIINKKAINKIINIKSEILFREAEDDFYYFNHLNKAMKKLKEAVILTPYHLKSIMLYADICFIKGFFNKALSLYLMAEKISSKNFKILASLANCYNSLKKSKEADLYCDLAINSMTEINYSLFSQLIEIKINNLVNLKKYKDAYITFIQSQNILDAASIKNIYTSDYVIINEKLKLQKKLHYLGLKIV